jgi:hypothetical protein
MGFVEMGFAGKYVNGFRHGLIPEKKSNIDLNEQIAQLMEQEAPLYIYIYIFFFF